MNPEDLAIQTDACKTAFSFVVESGDLGVAQAMLIKNSDLALIYDENWMLPLGLAAQSGHKQMVDFLYDETKGRPMDEQFRNKMFHTLIRTGFYDLALDLLKEHPGLATSGDSWVCERPGCKRTRGNKEKAIHILARRLMISSSFANQNQEGTWKKSFNLFSSSNKFRNKKPHPQALELVKLLWENVDLDASWVSRVIFMAVERENIEFLNIIIRDYPLLLLKFKENSYSIFHAAVLNRQNDIFKLIYKISPSLKNKILRDKDREENNILHLAGMLPPPHRRKIVSGATLQLQQELMWFEEVSKIVSPLDVEAENRSGKTPRALFTEMHVDLVEKGEREMKETSNSCLIVSTLIATVAAAFAIPGCTKEDTRTSHFIERVPLITFVVSDTISLVSSTCSILIFLSILASRHQEEDFRSILPTKLVVGLSTLLLSIAAMMVVFCSIIFIIFKDGMVWVPILVSIIASFPVILFTKQHWRLPFDVAHSTFKVGSLLQTSQYTLFDVDKGKAKDD